MTNNHEAIDKIANAIIDSRPDLEPLSLDEWLLEHSEKLSLRETDAAIAILRLYDEQ
ncbi:hypothetical protein [Phyllobacterium myrsinacearum]|uniref:Uncharacterized protein n=1 Tax=Phyllobacterium myrsinacearum TaxID=28101 RepID=A0A839EM61_9HYPH|nr:hypothetical protein [Phyllobacterium myrsinacearum]MBA8881643.1 hypothetical protein [Phyllobacterium myrsinacearum]